MKQIIRTTLVAMVVALAGCTSGSSESDGSFDLELTPVFTNLSFELPLALLQAPGDASRFFVVEKRGTVRQFTNADDVATTSLFFEDTLGLVDAGPGEAGLLGMAFHPDYANNQTVFLSYTRDGSPLVSYVSRYQVSSGQIDITTEQPVLTVDQPFGNHNGGQIGFGPDGYLYIGLGDGGSGGDPMAHGQNIDTLLGAMLRIDVDAGVPYAIPADNPFAASPGCGGGSGCPEIYAWGLRNPWRWSFDRDTGDLWVGDVGQSSWEEINRVTLGGNYGWNQREGAHCFVPACETAALTDPVVEHDRSEAVSITGGYVYRGARIAELQGYYVYGDYGTGRIWALAGTAGATAELLFNTSYNVASFGEGNDGELYVVDIVSGSIYRLAAR